MMLSTVLIFTTNTILRLSQALISRKTKKNHNPLFYIAMLAIAYISAHGSASYANEDVWHGEWQAENTDFSLRVVPAGDRFYVEPIQSLGLNWHASDGVLNGKNGTIHVQYEGVTAQVMVQLISQESAIVRPLACQPDYHVICTLVRNQQARFIKQPGS